MLDSQFQRITVVIDRPNARKQDRIKAYIIAECGQQRRNLQCDTLHLIVRAGLVQIEKYIADIIQPPPTEFERFDRIGKSRFPGIAGDGGYFGACLPERMTESRQIMFVANPVECRCGVRTGQRCSNGLQESESQGSKPPEIESSGDAISVEERVGEAEEIPVLPSCSPAGAFMPETAEPRAAVYGG